MNTEKITVETHVNADIDRVWENWTKPEHIVNWNFASDDWCCPSATNDLRAGGKFTARMESIDGDVGFDFEGTYDEVIEKEKIVYSLADGRRIDVTFAVEGGGTHVSETFDPEQENPAEMQKAGWQAILDNFKSYVEAE